MFRWLAGRGAPQRKVEREMALLTPGIWRRAVAAHGFLTGLSAEQDENLRRRSAWILASKDFSGAQGMVLTDDIMLSIAIQAALPILELDPALYDGWTEIIVYPGGFMIPHSDVDESGVVHEYVMEASGEAWDGGPVILSWEDAGPDAEGANVVIHEFAHKLDLYAGEADGIPWLEAGSPVRARQWRKVLNATFNDFSEALIRAEDAIPRHVNPESEEALPWLGALPLDPYAASDPAEFFAVSSEAFFVEPAPLAQIYPEWYGLLSQYYRQDPLRRMMQNSVE